MTKEAFIYSDKPGVKCTSGFTVGCDKAVLITSTVEAELTLFRRYGCAPNYHYKPLLVDGAPVVVSPETACPLVVGVPGNYTLQDPDVDEPAIPPKTPGHVFYEEVSCAAGNFSAAAGGGGSYVLDPSSIAALCECINTALEMTLNITIDPENKDLLAQCIAKALASADLNVTLSNADEVAALICEAIAPKLEALGVTITDALAVQTTALVAAIVAQTEALCKKFDAQTLCLEDIKKLLTEKCVVPATPVCKKIRRFKLVYDNGMSAGSSTNNGGERQNLVHKDQQFTSVGWNTGQGDVGVGTSFGPYSAGAAGWTAQLTAWAAYGTTNDPYGSTHNIAFYPARKWRVWEVSGCDPHAMYGTWSLERDDGTAYEVYPICYSETIEKLWCVTLVDCETGQPTTKYYREGKAPGTYVGIAAPSDLGCYVDCNFVYAPVIMPNAVSGCTSIVELLCDVSGDSDVKFIRVTDICDGVTKTTDFTFESWATAQTPDDLEAYTPKGKVQYCNGDPYTPRCTLADFAQSCPEEACARVLVSTNRGGWTDPRSSLFTVGTADKTYGPFDTAAELTTALEADGYTVSLVDAGSGSNDTSYFIVCGSPPVLKLSWKPFTTDTASSTAFEQLPVVSRKFLATLGKNDDRRDSTLQLILDKLGKLCPEDAPTCPAVYQGESFNFDADGNPLPFPISFPYVTDPGAVQDFNTVFGIQNADCITAPRETLVRTRFYFRCHDLSTGSNGTTGFNLSVPDGVFVQDSATNTFDNTSNIGTSSATVGVSNNGSRDKADRWLDFDISLGNLLDLTTTSTSAFGGVPTAVTEYLGGMFIYFPGVDWESLGCEGC